MSGQHGDRQIIMDAISFATEYSDETIAIGGGEPTLHPDFFDIIKKALWNFDYVWMATNGSQTDKMHRLANIIHGEDYPECDCLDRMEEEEFEKYGCLCHEQYDYDMIENYDDKLSVALSQDVFHSDIDQSVIDIWKRNKWEIRTVTNSIQGLSNTGRAKDNDLGQSEECCCSDLFITPEGKVKLCGCLDSPVIGDIYNGIEEEWENVLYNDESFNDYRCHKHVTSKKAA
jgi:MoaA/NifB/PqqE/SkfB family radical SAM enzyme